ncbi:MAG: hypothetical protein II852_14235 [Bacteroidales bacterium]|nr:hypothetical protein [Bacteroidales bacterium]
MEVTLNNVLSIDSLYDVIADKYPGLKKEGRHLSLEYDGFLLNITHNKNSVYEISRDVPLIKFFVIGTAILFAWIFVVVGIAQLVSKLNISISPEVAEYVARFLVVIVAAVPVAVGSFLWKLFTAKSLPAVTKLSDELASLCNAEQSQMHLKETAPVVIEDIKTTIIKKWRKKMIISLITAILLFGLSRIAYDKSVGVMFLSVSIVVGLYAIYCIINFITLKKKLKN